MAIALLLHLMVVRRAVLRPVGVHTVSLSLLGVAGMLPVIAFGSGLVTFVKNGGLWVNRLRIKEFKPFLRWLLRALRP